MEVFKDIAKIQEVAAALSGKNKDFYDSFTDLGAKLKTLDEQWEGDDKQALITQINGDYKVYSEFYSKQVCGTPWFSSRENRKC